MPTLSVYDSANKGEVFNVARTELVDLMLDFKEQLRAANVWPNITDCIDNHEPMGAQVPYATVGLSTVVPEYVGKGATFDVRLYINADIRLHIAPLDGQYDEREKWTLLNSLLNYLKNLGTLSSNVHAFYLGDIDGNATFERTGETGAIFNVRLEKIASG